MNVITAKWLVIAILVVVLLLVLVYWPTAQPEPRRLIVMLDQGIPYVLDLDTSERHPILYPMPKSEADA